MAITEKENKIKSVNLFVRSRCGRTRSSHNRFKFLYDHHIICLALQSNKLHVIFLYLYETIFSPNYTQRLMRLIWDYLISHSKRVFIDTLKHKVSIFSPLVKVGHYLILNFCFTDISTRRRNHLSAPSVGKVSASRGL